MRILVTGAGGFIGRALMQRLLAEGLDGAVPECIVVVDLALDGLPPNVRVQRIPGSITAPGLLERALAVPVDAVFHLASVPGRTSEKDPTLGRRVNLDATLRLVELLRAQGNAPRLVFARTVAVYGDSLRAAVDDDTPARPSTSYGAHKLAAEVLIADADRRGWLRACSLRLPGVVARPGGGDGLVSAFMSELFWKLSAGVPIVLPVRADGTAWWISVQACADNLVHAAGVDTMALDATRVVQMPAPHLAMHEVVEALTRRCRADRRSLVRYVPEPTVQRLFASLSPLRTVRADALGFAHDGSTAALVQRAMQRAPMS